MSSLSINGKNEISPKVKRPRLNDSQESNSSVVAEFLSGDEHNSTNLAILQVDEKETQRKLIDSAHEKVDPSIHPPETGTDTTIHIPTASQYIVKPHQYTEIPPELSQVDFSQRISWRKFAPYTPVEENSMLPLVPCGTPANCPTPTSRSPALEFHVHALSGRARATTLHLHRHPDSNLHALYKSREVPTPIFMPVGTKGTIKSLTTEEIIERPELSCPIILANTYHLALQPGTELIRSLNTTFALHDFIGGWHDRAILTDSGGFQMVSLLKLAEITEEGVSFENPFWNSSKNQDTRSTMRMDPTQDDTVPCQDFKKEEKDKDDNRDPDDQSFKVAEPNGHSAGQRWMLLRPEDSITHQNNIGADIIMALDDVVSSVSSDPTRFKIATYRTLRWLDRCYAAHSRPYEQNLFAIVQGGLDTSLGGLREQCLAGFRIRDHMIPGYAIGGLAGGESKEAFWKVVDQCCRALPDDKPRYLMGVGYPLDLVVCTALGVDMYDCVYPTRTARFGVALINGEAPGTLRLKSNDCSYDNRVIMEGCACQACAGGYTRSRLHSMLKTNNPLAATLMTNHNIAYMMYLVRGMRQAILDGTYDNYVRNFVNDQFRGRVNGGQDVPKWVIEALDAAGISIK